MNLWTLLAAVVFGITRALIYLRYDEFVSDVPLYQIAGDSIRKGLAAYCEFWFPYPPLSLPIVWIPALIGDPNERYRALFRGEMLLFDILCFAGVWIFLRNRTKASDARTGLALIGYSLLGLGMGHLLLDRLDIVMTAVFIWSVYFFTSKRPWGRNTAYLLLLAGALIKLLPIFLLPVFMILEAYSDDEKWPALKRSLLPLKWVAAPFAIVIVIYNQTVCENLIPRLAEQGSRGIQIESNWAIPLIIFKIFGDWPLTSSYIYGAFHLGEKGVPPLYLLLSKYAGFTLLLVLYVYLARKFYRSLAQTEKFAAIDVLYLFYLPLLLIVGAQRVLSPQYMIWFMPLAGIQMAIARRPMAAFLGAGAIFGLTYTVFDLGFFPILEFHPWYSIALLFRNILLAVWMADIGRRVLRSLRKQRQDVIAGV